MNQSLPKWLQIAECNTDNRMQHKQKNKHLECYLACKELHIVLISTKAFPGLVSVIVMCCCAHLDDTISEPLSLNKHALSIFLLLPVAVQRRQMILLRLLEALHDLLVLRFSATAAA